MPTLLMTYFTLPVLLTVAALGSPLPSKGDRQQTQNEVWVQENNFVEPAPVPLSPLDLVNSRSSKEKISLKTLIKALYRFNALNKSEVEEVSMPAETEIDVTTEPPDEDYVASSPAPPLVDELTDIFYITSQIEMDKSHKFTHSFRFGYGAPH